MPIDVTAYRIAVAGGNASRRRRFTTDPARRRWYAEYRLARFARRFGDRP